MEAECQIEGENDFYPRPLRGGRHYSFNITAAEWVFLSTPSARRATDAVVPYRAFVHISIHALCEEGDFTTMCISGNPALISIHALCEEGDEITTRLQGIMVYFYPRPLRGGRRTSSPFLLPI